MALLSSLHFCSLGNIYYNDIEFLHYSNITQSKLIPRAVNIAHKHKQACITAGTIEIKIDLVLRRYPFLCTLKVELVIVLDVSAALDAIEDVREWRSLGVHLGIKSSKLDEIGRCSIEEQKTRLVSAWFECGVSPNWEKLYTAKTRVAENTSRAK